MKTICKHLDCVGIIIVTYVLYYAPLTKAQSCRAAGYTECCNQDEDVNSCEGRPLGICYCDPSCRQYDDCCEDIMEICHPEKDALLAQIKPLVAYVTDITYQSAMVHWITPTYYSNDSNTTLFYIMEYSTVLQNSNTTAAPYRTSINVVSLGMNSSSETQEQYAIKLSGLQKGRAYNFTLAAQTRFGTLDLDTVGAFTTLDLDRQCIENVYVEILNTTAVQVFWSSLNLLPGVTIAHYTVHYRETSDELPLGLEDSSMVNSDVNCYSIGGLNEGVWYSFVVMATITEKGGEDVDVGPCSERVDIFVPASRLFQLTAVGIFSSPCSLWEMEEELLLINIFRTKVLSTLQDFCNCNYTSNRISNDGVICHSSTPSIQTVVQDTPDHMATHRITYRGTLWSTPDSSTDYIIACIERWVRGDPVIGLRPADMAQDGANTHSGTTPLISLDIDCPVRLRLNSQPLCDPSIDIPTVQLRGTQTVEGDDGVCVTLPIFVASLVAMFLFLLVIMMVVVICMLLMTRKHKVSVTDEGRHSQSQQEHTQVLHNVYTPSPHTSETMATTTAVHTHSRPLAIRVTESSESGPVFPLSTTTALPARNNATEGTSENEANETSALDTRNSSIANEPARVFTGESMLRRSSSSDSLTSLDFETDDKDSEEKEEDERNIESVAISTTV